MEEKELSQGAQANKNGHLMEDTLYNVFKEKGYEILDYKTYLKSKIKPEKCLIKQYPFVNIYGSERARVDFVIINKAKKINQFCELKTQIGAGSVSEKLPYVYMNLALKYPSNDCILVTVGDGFAKGGIDWFKKQCEDRFLLDNNPDKMVRHMTIGDYISYAMSNL